MKKITFLLTTLTLFAFSWLGSAQLTEDFDGATFPPTDWTMTAGSGSIDQSSETADHTTGAANFARYDCYNISGTTPAYLTSPRLVVSSTDKTFSFWTNYYFISGSWGNTAELYVDVSSDGGATWTSGTTNLINGQEGAGWFQTTLDLTNYEATDFTGNDTYVRFKMISDYGSYNIAVDDVAGPAIYVPACGAPTALNTDTITTTSANVNWTDGPGIVTANTVTVTPAIAGSPFTVNAGVQTLALSGLTANTQYTVDIANDCGANPSDSIAFTTLCDANTTFPYVEDFEGTFLPDCWSKQVQTGNDITQSADADHTTSAGNSARFSSYSSSSDYNQYLITEPQTIDAGFTELSFWHQKSNSGAETLEWGISTSPDPATYTWTAVTLEQSVWNEETVDLTAYVGQTIYIGFHYYGNYLYYVYLDDVKIDVAPSCLAPDTLTATNITIDSADLNWTAASGAVDYNWEVQPQGVAQGTAGALASGTGVAGVTVNTGAVLTANTSYDFFVQTNCGGGSTSTWTSPSTFYTGYCQSVPTSNDGNGISNVQLGTANFANGDVTYFDHTGTVVDIAQSTSANLQITFETGYTYDTNVWIDFNDDLVFDASEQVFDGVSTSSNPTTLDASFSVPAAANLGNHSMRIGTADTGQATPDPCYSGSYGVTLDFMVNVTVPPTCAAPTTLTTDTVTTTTANVNWTDGIGIVTANTVTVTPAIAGSPFTVNAGVQTLALTGLTSGTAYTVDIANDCGANPSDTVAFSTLVPPPANNDCANAEALTVGTVFADNEVVGTNVSATASGEIPTPSCSSFGAGQDVWYSVMVPASGDVTIETASDAGSSLTDTGMQVYSGACGSLVAVECDDDGGTGFYSLVELCGRTPGEILLVRVFEYGNNTFDTFTISAYDAAGGTSWNGSAWSNGAPTIGVTATIDGVYTTTANGDIDACGLIVTASGDLTVNVGGYANINNNISNAGTITVENTGSVVQINDDATVTGAGTFTTNVDTTNLQDADRFTYFGTPSASQNGSVFSAFTAVWEFNEATQYWAYAGNGSWAGALVPGHGYAVQGATGVQSLAYDGAFNNGEITMPLVLDVGQQEPDTLADDDDATFVGNPYPSGIDSAVLIANNDINECLIWTHDSALDTAQTGGWAGDDYIVCTTGGCTNAPTGGTHTGIIATGQGFFVNATAAGTLTFNNAMRVTAGNDQFRNSIDSDKLWLNMSSPQGYNSNVLLSFTENGSTNFDAKIDAKKPLSTTYGLSFYALNNNLDKLAIDDLGQFTDTMIVPVGYIHNDNSITELTFNINNIQNLVDVNVYVKDNLLNVTHDLKISNYTFNVSNTGEYNDRFEILFSRSALATNEFETSNDSLVVSNQANGQVKVTMLDGSIITNLKAFDILGKLVIDTNTNSNSFELNTTLKQAQVVFVKATLENGQVLNKKFIKL